MRGASGVILELKLAIEGGPTGYGRQPVIAGADGRLWVQRYAPAADTRTPYDIIDRSGAVVARAYVPNAGRVVGFGARSIYVVRRDADDLQYLQRFPL